MLTIHIPDREYFDDETSEFICLAGRTLELEHSLASLAKWEEKWHEPFLGRVGQETARTEEQTLDYIRCMSVSPLTLADLQHLPSSAVDEVQEYINDPHTATTVHDSRPVGAPGRKQTITAELIYYWMIKLEIPFECESWNLNRLLMLIRVCEIKDGEAQKKNKMPGKSAMSQQRALNMQRRAARGSLG